MYTDLNLYFYMLCKTCIYCILVKCILTISSANQGGFPLGNYSVMKRWDKIHRLS